MAITDKLIEIADAIRAKTGETELLSLSQMPNAIASIPTGIELPALTAPAAVSDVLKGKEYIGAAGEKRTGTLVVCDTVQKIEDGWGFPGIGVDVKIESTADGSSTSLRLPEPNLKSENIVAGSSIFGVQGTAKTLRVKTGTFTLAENIPAPAVIHNLGVIPDLVIVEAADHDNTAYSIFGFVAVRPGFLSCEQFGGVILINNATGMESSGLANTNGKNAFNNGLSDTRFVCAYNSGNYKYRAGWTYKWKVFAGLT